MYGYIGLGCIYGLGRLRGLPRSYARVVQLAYLASTFQILPGVLDGTPRRGSPKDEHVKSHWSNIGVILGLYLGYVGVVLG